MVPRALLAIALVACGSSAPPVGPSNKVPAPSYAASLEDVLGFLPADSELVVGIDAAQIRKTAIWAQLRPKIEQLLGDDLTQLEAACGFDPMQTVTRVSLGMRAPEANRVAGVVVVEGVGAGMLGCVRTHFGKGGDAVDDRGVVILDPQNHRAQSAWTVIGSTLIVEVGPAVGHDSMQQVLGSGSPLRTSHAFMELYGRLGRGASMWGVVNGKTRMLDDLDAMGMRPVTLDGTLNVSDRLVLDGRAVFASAGTAAKVDALLGQSLKQIAKYTERGESRVEGSRVVLDVSISRAQLAQLLGNF